MDLNLEATLRVLGADFPQPPPSPFFSLTPVELARARAEHGRDREAAAWALDAHWVLGTPEAPDYAGVVCGLTLEPLLHQVCGLPYTTDIADVNDPVALELGKALWAKSQSRKSGTVSEKHLLPDAAAVLQYAALTAHGSANLVDPADLKFVQRFRAQQDRRVLFQRILLCGLLGNYSTLVDGERVACVETRKRLYRRVMNPVWFQAVLHGCPELLVWCKRAFVVHLFDTHPSLQAALGGFVHLDAFRSLLEEALGLVRRYVRENLSRDWTSLGAFDPPLPPRDPAQHASPFCTCLRGQRNYRKGEGPSPAERARRRPPCRFAGQAWTRDLKQLLLPIHLRMSAVNFRKPARGVERWLRGRRVRVRFPLVPRPLAPSECDAHAEMEATARAAEQEEEDRDRLQDALLRVFGPAHFGPGAHPFHRFDDRFRDIVGHATRAREREQFAQREDAQAVARVFRFLTPAQFHWLHAAVQRLAPGNLLAVVGLFDALGVREPGTVTFVQHFLLGCTEGWLPLKQRERRLDLLRRYAPHAYNLLQVAVELTMRQSESHLRVVGQLSVEATQAQVAALQRRTLEALQCDDRQQLKLASRLALRARNRAAREPARFGGLVAEVEALQAFFEARLARTAAAFAAQPRIEASGAHLYLCRVCHRIYSNVRQAARPGAGAGAGAGGTAAPTHFRWGLASAWRNHRTGTLHCSANLVDFTGECASQPLVRVNLIGLRFAVDNDAFQLCARCGDVMRVASADEHCVDAGEGLLCAACSEQHRRASRQQPLQPVLDRVARLATRCAVCRHTTTDPRKTTLLAFDQVLCRKCARPALVRYAVRLAPLVGGPEEQAAKLGAFWAEQRTRRIRLQAARGDYKMKQSRQRTRQRRR